jgi:tetratricopeptide (TPR) repeat protein
MNSQCALTYKETQRILDMNNEGVWLFNYGQHEPARECFKNGLEETTRIINIYRQDLQEEEFPEAASQACSPITRVQLRGVGFQANGVTGSYVCRYAMAMDRSVACYDFDYLFSLRLTVVLMFNLGLVHHWRAIQYQQSSLLVKALRLYEMVWGLLQLSPSLDPSALGVLNNMGAVHYELAQYEQSHKCFEMLKNALMDGSVTLLEEEPEAQDGILLNLMFLEEPSAAPAA